MIAAIRAFAKSWFARILLSVLILSFVIFGVGSFRDVFRSKINNAVITAGSRQISTDQFKRMFDNYIRSAEQQSGQQVTMQEAVAQHVDTRVLQEVATQEAFAEFLTRSGLNPAGALIVDALRKQPAFFDQVSGRFDKTAYQQKLAENQLTPALYESILADEIAQNQLQSGVQAGFKAPLTYEAVIAAFELESRSLSYFLIDPRKLPQPAPPTDAQLQAFLTQNAQALKQPEFRTLTVVRFSAKALAPTLTADPAAVQKLYDFRKDSLSTPEKRTLVEVPAKDAATAQAIAAKLKAGVAPDVAAKAAGVQPIIYTEAAKGAIADPKVADAAFSLTPGQVSGPIQGNLGFAVLKLTSITPAKTTTLDQARPDLEAQVKTDAAAQKIYDQVQKYDDSHTGGAAMADAAKASGGTLVAIGPVTAQGQDLSGHPVPGLSPKLLKDAFALSAGGESDMEDEGGGEYFAVRVDKITPPALPALAEIKDRLTQYFVSKALSQAMQAKADELIAAIKKGQSLDAAAASIGSPVGHAPNVTRAAMSQNRSLSPELANKLFSAKQGDTVDGPTAQGVIMVARVDQIQSAAVDAAAHVVVAQNRQFSGQMVQDLGEMMQIAARQSIKPTIDQARARTALGVSAEDAAKASGAAPAGAGGKAP
ncbi:MAG TPA: peptidyl-prolyl cis-trans isomerase [Caulobacteraceae bacterium]|jgi:peptidyl-prolyl cis-trans isomerase D|nr:peptidyl-prolyl cis-trans isomerase [Caulobacteraceae bacterium]